MTSPIWKAKMISSRSPLADIALAIATIVIAGIFIGLSLDLPPPEYEPLGPASVPVGVALCCDGLSIFLLVRASRELQRTHGVAPLVPAREIPGRLILKTSAVLLWTGLYVASMTIVRIPFVWSTAVYLTALSWMLSGFRPKSLLVSAAIALIVAFGCEYVFTHIFTTNLP